MGLVIVAFVFLVAITSIGAQKVNPEDAYKIAVEQEVVAHTAFIKARVSRLHAQKSFAIEKLQIVGEDTAEIRRLAGSIDNLNNKITQLERHVDSVGIELVF